MGGGWEDGRIITVPISWAQVVVTTAASGMPPATLTRQRTTFALSLSPTTSAPLDCPPYLHPTPAVVRVAPRHRPAAAVGQLAIVAISCLLHVKYCILSTLQRRDKTMLCAVLPCLLRRRNSVPPLCLVRLQRCPHG
jgi:hypothetical protein